MNVRILDFESDREALDVIKKRSQRELSDIEDSVRDILLKVKNDGDSGLKYYTEKFDNVKLDDFIVTKKEIEDAYEKLSKIQIGAIKNAIANVKKFAESQMPKNFSTRISEGIECSVLLRPILKIGCYIPGGRYPLPSTTYMTIIPAKVAGVKEIVVASPPDRTGKINPAILVAADLSGVTKIIKAGGAQAIASLAYGTETIPKVDKIVGPGNIYVTTAKRLVYGEVGIDMPAGPSELIIIASGKSTPRFIASDMLAQAEHDPLACALLLTDSTALAGEVKKELEEQARKLSTKDTIERSFEKYSAIVIMKSVDEAILFSNSFAPEHLEIMGYGESMLSRITCAGSVFFGEYSCEAAGDYCSGTNHVLPTGQFSRVRGGLSVFDFLKMMTVQSLTKEGLAIIGKDIVELAKLEGLSAHANSVLKRLEE